jgi:hypothetical protein
MHIEHGYVTGPVAHMFSVGLRDRYLTTQPWPGSKSQQAEILPAVSRNGTAQASALSTTPSYDIHRQLRGYNIRGPACCPPDLQLYN